jgi:hypothetical protein
MMRRFFRDRNAFPLFVLLLFVLRKDHHSNSSVHLLKGQIMRRARLLTL